MGWSPNECSHTDKSRRLTVQSTQVASKGTSHPAAISQPLAVTKILSQTTGISTTNLGYWSHYVFDKKAFSKQLLPREEEKKSWSETPGTGFRLKIKYRERKREEKHHVGAQQHFPKMQDENPAKLSLLAPLSQICSAQPRTHACASLHPQGEVWQAWTLTTTKKDKVEDFPCDGLMARKLWRAQ